MMRKEIRIAGSGGMGVVLAGVVLGHAAVVYAGLNAVQTQAYGSEARGTDAKSEVIISDAPILYPKVIKSDYAVLMSQKAFDTNVSDAKEGSVILVDPDLVDCRGYDSRFEILRVPAIVLADRIGNRMAANMVMLGALVARSRVFSIEVLERSITQLVPSKSVASSIQAARLGSTQI